jgi:hypothetical protein
MRNQMSNIPKITVIIPTRERCDVLEHSLRTITAQNYDNLEIIVSDNFSNDSTADVVKRANDSRIKYLNTGRRLSMSHNWEFALSHVVDGWVTFIGDDDGLLPKASAAVAEIIKSTDAKIIRSNFCNYVWPSSKNELSELTVPMGSGLEIRSSTQWLSKVMQGHQKYTQLPMIYNGGFIHISVLNELREKTGSYFRSVSPDIYSAVAISSASDSFIYSKEPFAISGTSKHSTGNSFFSTDKARNQIPKAQFSNEGNLPFHADIPLYKDGSYPASLQICVYEAYLQSMSLRPTANEFSRAQQLEVILATAGKHREAIEKWGMCYASMHSIDYEQAKRSAIFSRLALQSQAAVRKTVNAMNSVIVDRLPLKNIFEASIAAAVIRSSAGRADTLKYLVRQLVKLAK